MGTATRSIIGGEGRQGLEVTIALLIHPKSCPGKVDREEKRSYGRDRKDARPKRKKRRKGHKASQPLCFKFGMPTGGLPPCSACQSVQLDACHNPDSSRSRSGNGRSPC